MGYTTKQIQRTITISKKNLLDMIIAQNKSYKHWNGKLTRAAYKSGIANLAATALGFVFKTTSAAVAYSVISGAVTWASTAFKKEMALEANIGLVYLNDILDILHNHKNYKSVQVKIPYIQFTNLKTGKVSTVINGTGKIIKFNTKTGSVPA